MEYAKLVSVEITNFMAFKHARIVFDESGVINLKGYNGSGKSAIEEAVYVCMMDAFKSKQVKMIRHGEEYFRIVLTFEDGISILRDKYINGQSLYEMYNGEECIFTTKVGNKLTRVDGVPEVISKYLGLCITDSVCLNYVSRRDKQLLTETKGSENYQALHEILRMAEIYKASNMITSDKNEKVSQINELEVELQKEEALLATVSYTSESLINALEERETISDGLLSQKSDLENMLRIADELSGIKRLPSMGKVELSQLKSIMGIVDVISELESLPDIPKMPKVEVARIKSLVEITDIMGNLESIKSYPVMGKIDSDRFKRLYTDILQVASRLLEMDKGIEDIHDSIDEKRSELEVLVEEASKKGIGYVKCDNCGSYVMVGGDHNHAEDL